MRGKQYFTNDFTNDPWVDEIERRYGDTVDKYVVEPSPSILDGISWRVSPNTVGDQVIRYKDTLWTQVTDTRRNYLADWTREIAERQRAEEIHKALGTLAEIREADANDMDEDNDGKTLDWLFE